MNKIWQYFLINKESLANLLYNKWKLKALENKGVDNWFWCWEVEWENEDDIIEWLNNNDWLRIGQSIMNKIYNLVEYNDYTTDYRRKTMVLDKLFNISDSDFISLFNENEGAVE